MNAGSTTAPNLIVRQEIRRVPTVAPRLPFQFVGTGIRWWISMSSKEVINTLNNLIKTCRDGQDRFRRAAENIRNSEFRRLFNIFSQQRAQFLSELLAEVHRLGGEPVDHGSPAAALGHNVIDFKSALMAGDEASIIAECQDGE